jgi:hypothetical protein
MQTWWAQTPEERYWMEITARDDLGADLNAPDVDEQGRQYWSYQLIREVNDGDIILHYWKPEEAIVAYSTAVGSAWQSDVIWGARGASARGLDVTPYWRPGWRLSLQGFTPIEPITLAALRDRQDEILAIRSEIAASGKPPYFPFAPYRGQSIRTFQGYLVKVPLTLVALLSLEFAMTASAPAPSPAPTDLGIPYRPAPRTTIRRDTEPWSRDPSLVDRALLSHAETQDDLSAEVLAAGLFPRSPGPGEPDYDIAWETDHAVIVGEVKSLTTSNEERQLRLGLGQVLRYADLMKSTTKKKVIPILALEHRPSDERWLALCTSLDVPVGWVGHWSAVVNP